MADIDGLILDYEFGIGLLLVGQLLWCRPPGHSGTWPAFSGEATLGSGSGSCWRYSWRSQRAAGLCTCAREARTSIQGRLDGRIPGQFVSEARGQNHLAFVWRSGLAGGTILAATILGSGLLHYLARRGCEKVSSP